MNRKKATAGRGTAFYTEGVQHSSLPNGFGQALAVSGDTLAAGSLGPALSIYQRLPTGWVFQQTLTTSCMASAVALDGGTLTLRDGAPGTPGAVSTYRRSGTRWIARAILYAPLSNNVTVWTLIQSPYVHRASGLGFAHK
jgi:hypothetical protein